MPQSDPTFSFNLADAGGASPAREATLEFMHSTLHEIQVEVSSFEGAATAAADDDDDDAQVPEALERLRESAVRESRLRERITSLESGRTLLTEEVDELREAVQRAGAAFGQRVTSLSPHDLCKQIQQLRHDGELLRLRSSIEARELLIQNFGEFSLSIEREIMWTKNRMVRFCSSSPDLLASLHAEVDGLSKAIHAALRKACRGVRGKMLPTKLTPLLNPAPRGAAIRKDQLHWLQACCGLIFPHCLVCIFDPAAQDELDEGPWTVLEACAPAVSEILAEPSKMV